MHAVHLFTEMTIAKWLIFVQLPASIHVKEELGGHACRCDTDSRLAFARTTRTAFFDHSKITRTLPILSRADHCMGLMIHDVLA